METQITVPRERVRRSQGERTAETRARVLQAATTVLAERGYSGAGLVAVAKRAGISLGALQHHFPSKALLMAAVLIEYLGQMREEMRVAVHGIADPLGRLDALGELSWRQIQKPIYAAMMEISLARRNDPELADATARTLNRARELNSRWLNGLARKAGSTDRQSAENLIGVFEMVLRGLAMEIARGQPAEQLRPIFETYFNINQRVRREILKKSAP